MTTVIGIDVQSIDDVGTSLARYGERYSRRLFTDRELEECRDEPERAVADLARRFAAKEAALKILCSSDVVPPWRSIEIRGNRARPEVLLSGTAAEVAYQKGLHDFSVSFSDSAAFAIATVTAEVATPTSGALHE